MRKLVTRFKTQTGGPAVAGGGGVRVQTAPTLTGNEAAEMCRAFESLDVGSFWITDGDGRLTYLSGNAPATLTRGEGPVGQSFIDLFVPSSTGTDGQRTLSFVFARKSHFEGVIARSEADGQSVIWSISGDPINTVTGGFAGFRGHIVDVTAERESAEENSRMAMHDPLTGLMNRRHMTGLLSRIISAYAPQRRPVATMLIDLDRFKAVNDTLGHGAGDTLLKQVAQRMIKVIGDAERISRIGGDEFQVVFPDVDDRERLAEIAEQVISLVSEPYTIEGNRCTIGATVGVAISPHDGASAEELVRNADLALYEAKHAGRGRHRFYASTMHDTAAERRRLEEDLHDALLRGELELYYQPLVKTETSEVVGTEALIRWHHPELGSISPAVFIPIAEELNLIIRIGEWILNRACEDAAGWPSDIRVAVNVSPIQFADPGLPRIVASALAATGLDPDRLELEITEGVFLGESAATDAMFRALKGLGVRLVLDDFGTGYSSLSYLKTAPFDKIKIDQSFIRGATNKDVRNRAIIAAIVALAEALGMDTIAEGVETHDQLEMVRELKIGHVQGYIFSKPVALADLFKGVPAEQWIIAPDGPSKQRHDRMAVFRSIGVIHDDHYYPVMLRNLSISGALIEGLINVPIGTELVLDFGEGQYVMATVVRSREHTQGVEFEEELVCDHNGALTTRRRVSRRHLAAAGVPRNFEDYIAHHAKQMASSGANMPKFELSSREESSILRVNGAQQSTAS